jgi:hypothetical protein
LPLAHGVQQSLLAKTPSHTSFSVFQMLLILLQVESKQDVSTSLKYIQIPNCFSVAAGQDD